MTGPDSLEREAMALLSEVLDIPEDQQAEFLQNRCAGNEALYNRVTALLNADSDRGEILRTGGAGRDSEEDPAPERAGAYRIVDLIGRGGMGAVYMAARDKGDFDHRVAVKVIRPGALRTSLVERFNRERQILASLAHPNIARLYDGGYLEDGSPYIVMEFVDGEPLISWAAANEVGIDGRLSLFSTICAAIGHAHQNLIVHRDITPSNVLVTHEGAVKLIDFGIAKPHDVTAPAPAEDKSSETLASLSFTPGFAAPERAMGAPANTLSDIYSLGKLLEALIPDAGKRPELASIIARATAREPQARYLSVDALAEDIENYRTGHPVEAYQGSGAYRFSKFLSRHRLSVAAGSVAILGLAAALVLTLVQYNRAEAALASANARFDQARDLSRNLMFDVYDSFDKVAGTLEPRKDLADLVRNYVDNLALDASAPDDVWLEIGTIQSRLADLYGGIGIANFGETEISERLFDEAEQSLTLALEDEESIAEALPELIMVKRMQTMQSLNYSSDPAKAAEQNEETLRLVERGLQIPGLQERPFLRHLWSARTDKLQILFAQERYEEALAELAEWRPALTPEMYERLGGGEEMGAYLAMQQGETLVAMDRGEEALAPLEDAINFRRSQLEAKPESYYELTQLMTAESERSTAYRGMGDFERSLSSADVSVELARRVLAADPNDAGGPEGLAVMLSKKVRAHLALGQFDSALLASDESIEMAEGLTTRFPDDLFFEKLLYQMLTLRALVEATQSADVDACATVQKAEDLQARIKLEAVELDGSLLTSDRELEDAQNALGMVCD